MMKNFKMVGQEDYEINDYVDTFFALNASMLVIDLLFLVKTQLTITCITALLL